MSSILGSQGVVLATAMVVSSTVIFIAFSKQRNLNSPPTQFSRRSEKPLRSCLSKSDAKNKEKKKKKKRVRFDENVIDPAGNGEEYRREHDRRMSPDLDRASCRSEVSVAGAGMPANRAALYSGILRDRVHRIECSH